MKKIILPLIIFLSIASQAFASTDYCADPLTMAGLKWEEQSSTYSDCSGHSNVGTISGTVDRTATGKFLKGGDFTNVNNTYVTLGTASTIDNLFDAGGTFATYVAFHSAGTAGNICTGSAIASKDGSDGWDLCVNTDGSVKFSYKWAGGIATWTSSTAPVVFNNTFHHFMVYYNADSTGNTPTVLYDCSALTMTPGVAPFGTRNSDDTYDLTLGIEALIGGSGIGELDGIMDETILYNGNLTASCSALMADGIDGSNGGGSPPPPSGPTNASLTVDGDLHIDADFKI